MDKMMVVLTINNIEDICGFMDDAMNTLRGTEFFDKWFSKMADARIPLENARGMYIWNKFQQENPENGEKNGCSIIRMPNMGGME